MTPERLRLMSLDVDELLDRMRRAGWEFHYFGGRLEPHTLGAVYSHVGFADVVVLRGEDDAVAFRVVRWPETDVFDPTEVVWCYAESAVWTLRAVLTLALPTESSAPHMPMPAPVRCRVAPESRGTPYVIRPPHAAAAWRRHSSAG